MMDVKAQDIVLDVRTVMGPIEGTAMADYDYEKLLRSARSLLDRFMFEEDEFRDDVANLCMKIDDALPSSPEITASTAMLKQTETLNAAA